jgi:hypothetical protein
MPEGQDHSYGSQDLILRNMLATEPIYNSVIKHNGEMKAGLYLLTLGNAYGLIRVNGLTVGVSVAVGV